MLLKSTNPQDAAYVSFKDATLKCLPKTGGLYVPASMPDVRHIIYAMDERTFYPDLLAPLTASLLESEMDSAAARRVSDNCASIQPELQVLDERFSILHLCRGPTGSFKDFGITFLSAVLEEIAPKDEHLVVASSVVGSLGTSLAHAFGMRKNISCVLLYPQGDFYGLSPQMLQRPGGGGNIIPIRLKNSSPDDCAALLTDLISDEQWTGRYPTTSANAINPSIFLPQSFYYVYAFIKLKKLLTGELFFSVPSGHFGNLISGLYAWKFGLPVNGFIAAMNVNNALDDLWKEPQTQKRIPARTISPALDVSYPGNHRQLISLYNEVPSVMRNMVFPKVETDAETEDAIDYAWRRYNILIDPHTAVAFSAALKFSSGKNFDGHIVILSTGAAAKAPSLIRRVTGREIYVPAHLAELQKKSEPLAEIPCELDFLESAIASCF
ncbi:MAG: pyridoxal-phosphate dependent enzyme [Spirochaetaceae bacterium]|jgi:threonine synthase|nr:pyridoxal-phosphate dependent enzyme [Spirochaetaceae bacterium]